MHRVKSGVAYAPGDDVFERAHEGLVHAPQRLALLCAVLEHDLEQVAVLDGGVHVALDDAPDSVRGGTGVAARLVEGTDVGLDRIVHEGAKDVFLSPEVQVEGPEPEVGGAGDSGDRGALVTVARHQRASCPQKGAPVALLPPPDAG